MNKNERICVHEIELTAIIVNFVISILPHCCCYCFVLYSVLSRSVYFHQYVESYCFSGTSTSGGGSLSKR